MDMRFPRLFASKNPAAPPAADVPAVAPEVAPLDPKIQAELQRTAETALQQPPQVGPDGSMTWSAQEQFDIPNGQAQVSIHTTTHTTVDGQPVEPEAPLPPQAAQLLEEMERMVGTGQVDAHTSTVHVEPGEPLSPEAREMLEQIERVMQPTGQPMPAEQAALNQVQNPIAPPVDADETQPEAAPSEPEPPATDDPDCVPPSDGSPAYF